MATTAITVRLDAEKKKKFDELCQEIGMSANTAINIFVNQMVRSKSLPFMVTVETDKKEDPRVKFSEMFQRQRQLAEQGKTPDMTLDEINHEIQLARQEREQSSEA